MNFGPNLNCTLLLVTVCQKSHSKISLGAHDLGSLTLVQGSLGSLTLVQGSQHEKSGN